jgi:voltage-gated potassium channel
MQEAEPAQRGDVSPYQLFMLGLCVLVLAMLAVAVLVPLSAATRQVLAYADTCICAVFLLDFCLSLVRARKRWQYFYRWGWLDLLSSIPAIPALRIGRVARLVRIVRLLRGARSARAVSGFILERRAESSFLAVILLSMLMVVFSAIAVLHSEAAVPGANIRSASDALWWAVVTVTSVGYGDRYPVTSGGRFFASMLMISAVGLVGTFAGFVASWFLQPSRRLESERLQELENKIERLTETIESGRRDAGR